MGGYFHIYRFCKSGYFWKICSVILCFNVFLESHGQPQHWRVYKCFKDSVFEVGDKILAPEILFSNHHPIIRTVTQYSIKVIADFLKKNPTIKIELGVHTDDRGSEKYNFFFTLKRAQGIKDILVNNHDISPERVEPKGYGESDPIISEKEIMKNTSKQKQDELHMINRRIEITILAI